MNGGNKDQPILITSTPPGATILVDGQAKGITPATVSLSRDTDLEVAVESPGYLPYSRTLSRGLNPWLWGDLGWIYLAPAALVLDWWSHSGYALHPSSVKAELRPLATTPVESPPAPHSPEPTP